MFLTFFALGDCVTSPCLLQTLRATVGLPLRVELTIPRDGRIGAYGPNNLCPVNYSCTGPQIYSSKTKIDEPRDLLKRASRVAGLGVRVVVQYAGRLVACTRSKGQYKF